MIYKFIDEGKREHEKMREFIREFRTSYELLFKERNNSLSELRFEVQGLSKVTDNTLISNNEVKGVTTKGGKMTTQGDKSGDDSDLGTPIRRIDPFNTSYSVAQETARPDGVKS
ncbi:hypothetical protein Tco_1045981 [Tanacetum coccineum]